MNILEWHQYMTDQIILNKLETQECNHKHFQTTFLCLRNKILLLSKMNLISAVITSLSYENYLISIQLLIADSYKHIRFLDYTSMSQQLPYTRTHIHTPML